MATPATKKELQDLTTLRDIFVIQVLDGEKRYYRYILKGQCRRWYWSNSTQAPPIILKVRVKGRIRDSGS